jgi:predicted nucleic acid-binding Zn ribbon protein
MKRRARRCPACKKSFIPKRADARTCSNKCRQALHRRNHSFRRWRVLPPEGQGECDFNPEIEPAFADDKPHQFRHSAAVHQIDEAIRLAKEFALLRPGTEPHEISARRRRILPRVRAVIRAWRELLDKLRAAGRP